MAALTRRARRPRSVVLVGALVAAVVAGTGGLVAGSAVAATNPPLTGSTHPNVFSGAEAGFDGGIATWGAVGGTATAATSPVRSGSGALAIQRTGSDTGSVLARSATDASGWLTAVPGNRYVGSAWLRGPGRYAYARVTFRDAAGNALAAVAGQNSLDTTNGWVALPSAVAIAPPTARYVELDVSVMSVPIGERHYVDDTSLVTAPGGSPDVVGPLHTSGTQIIDAHGNPVVLRGFNRSGLERDATLAPTSDELDWAKAWGANAIRLNLGEQFWTPTYCPNYDSAYAGRVDTAVQQITSRGMLAILDLHWVTTTPCGKGGNRPMADAASAPTFWRQVAGRYKGNPLVAFELYNEPHSISDAVWLNGGSAPANAQGATYTVSGMQRLYDVVRATGATNLVIVSGNHYASAPSSLMVSGTNLVYTGHVYTCPNNLPPDCTWPNPLDPTPLLERWLDFASRVPFVLGEFGWRNPSESRYNEAVIAYAEARGWGWLQFSWQDGIYGPFDPFSTAGKGAPFEPAPAGATALAALPGASGSDSLLADLVDIRVTPSSGTSSPAPSPSPKPLLPLPLL